MNILIFGYGNPGRGDDALGPQLIERIRCWKLDGVECLDDMQLQVEHVTDLAGRDLVLFADADVSCDAPYQFEVLSPLSDDSYTSHAMSPTALLHAYQQVYRESSPPAFLLRMRGYRFELGDTLSTMATANLDAAARRVQDLCSTANLQRWHEHAGQPDCTSRGYCHA